VLISDNQKSNISTQHDTKVANNTDITPPTKLNDAQIKALRTGIELKKLKQADVARGVNESKGVIAKLVKGDPPQNTEERRKLLDRLERLLGVYMTGKQTGELKLTKPEQAKAVREAAKNATGK
jgi:ribosome-binding protein aMBF1 (putative translation factor)